MAPPVGAGDERNGAAAAAAARGGGAGSGGAGGGGAKQATTAILCSAGIGVTTIHITAPPTRIVREQPLPGEPSESSPTTTIVLKVSTTKSHLRKRWQSVDPGCCDEVLFSSALIIGKIDDARILSVRQLQVRRVLTRDESDVVLPLLALCAQPPDPGSEQLEGSWWFDPITNVPTHTLFVDLRHLQLVLPHDRNTGMYFEQIQNTAKAVKAIHVVDTPGLPPSAEAMLKPLADVVALRVGSLEFTMEDDPFEVQLGQNYRLQAEEAVEQKHRERLLKAKLETIGKSAPSGELDPSWIKSMFDLLGVASSSAYVQRATKLNNSEHSAPELFALTARELGLTFVPDVRLLGAEGIAATMHAVNKEAVAGHSDLVLPKSTFTFARRMALSTRELKVTLRDYGNPLLLAGEIFENNALSSCLSFQGDTV